VRDLLLDLLRLAREGLTRQNITGETTFLDPLDRRVAEEGSSPAVGLAADWEGRLRRDPRALVSALSGSGAGP